MIPNSSVLCKFIIISITVMPNFWILGKPEIMFVAEKWTPATTYEQIVEQARLGSSYYQGILGIFLRSGEAGCAVNLKLSRDWSLASWKKGHPFGAYNLANLAMLKGRFEEATQFYQDAALLLQRRASDGDPVAMYCMGEIDFQVIPTNVQRALGFFKKSAGLGYPQAQATIGALYLKGLPGLLEKNNKKGISLLSKAVTEKSLTARFNLGMAYYNGDGVKKDLVKASQWLRVAVRQNFSEAQYTLGVMLLEGEGGIQRNTMEGIGFLQAAANQDHLPAINYLKKREGNKLPNKTSHSVISSFTKRINSDEKLLESARKYFTGVGVTKNYSTAFSLFMPLAQGGNSEAARFVGLMKLTGKGTDKDLSSAKEWLSMAAQKGDKIARRMLDDYKSMF